MSTDIEWTDETWNCVKGCSRVSHGCERCYAERVAARFSQPGQPYEGLARFTPNGPRWTGKVVLDEEALKKPLYWKKPRKIFVNSMSDMFHENLRMSDVGRIFGVMAMCSQHIFQVLTKLPERMRDQFYPNVIGPLKGEACQTAFEFNRDFRRGTRDAREWKSLTWPLQNVWIGVSVEDQATADERIPLLLQTPAAVRFVSCEPLLRGIQFCIYDIRKLDWVIVGAESGPGARLMDVEWARDIVHQCANNRVPCFVKQLCDNGRKIQFDQWPKDLQVRLWPEVER